MNFNTTQDVTNNIFTTTTTFDSYGNLAMTAEDEQALLKDYPLNLTYSAISFTGKYTVNGKDIVEDETNGDTVSLVIPNKIIPIDENFIAKYSIAAAQVLSSELGTKLTTPELVAQAKCILFKDKVLAQINTLLTAVRAKDNNFAKTNPIKTTI
ncbi:hypothetical protein BJV85_002895 [Clostridium acetobutylicum]|uniref:Uncharacterized protein n=1 Tax=Clostridium acetobutylicum (strain ATCC 824 / DSM 792 / JCM 1419 / IAM 19013 / LMG 5710 / NBRC 13948 / NRRL B-527 / VKM B-1787 / 2291 / W) TaxID=272562 RepID=Q97K17_CLOAB|nr:MULTISPECIES: hypothetical protein [Clostridium]AAK79078.1 Hypothetical protein CA_C1104 [Clostridium acetobutylicum ATCC 824]ADZ20153.1 Conserved hypothetical protein [Clostridium acetobutylicum EA 2018]AEI31617.1 hypothetical protein SMB_G1122 [Clostridium acetobutylicum DSM 1731]AWV81668.1 hypothetical protein DK921_16535 [Clostridium acetobutylicum]MBC2393313.1 hypothetical protein [Clostridium acetobutylicum]